MSITMYRTNESVSGFGTNVGNLMGYLRQQGELVSKKQLELLTQRVEVIMENKDIPVQSTSLASLQREIASWQPIFAHVSEYGIDELGQNFTDFMKQAAFYSALQSIRKTEDLRSENLFIADATNFINLKRANPSGILVSESIDEVQSILAQT